MIFLSEAIKAKRAARDAAVSVDRERLAQRMMHVTARKPGFSSPIADAHVEAWAAQQILSAPDTMDVAV